MKKVVITITMVVVTIFNLTATEKKNSSLALKFSVDKTGEKIIKVYEWNVKTDSGIFSGTSPDLAHAEKMVAIVSRSSIKKLHQIESYYVFLNTTENKMSRLYYWEVKSEKGKAKGYSTNETSAKKMITLVVSGDIISYKIIKSSLRK